MSELVQFLRARLDDDELAARKAAALRGCHPAAPARSFRDGDEPTDGRILIVDEPHPGLRRKIGRRWNRSCEGLFMAQHIVRHDPARVLAEVDAKRRTIDLYDVAATSPELDRDAWLVLSEVVKLLAVPFASHPDYREEWKP
ncbi:DUF6221 family protein [Streptomyces flaveolus]|uniref:DUF6221 family protein n=1 Tax=Streptomyces flaveolus TaxID=67297 RepID=UPI0033D85DC0